MSLLTLILAIISFIFSFIPLFGIAITFIGALFCIVFIILLLKDKQNVKKKEVAVISTIVIVVAISVATLVNIEFFNMNLKNGNNINNNYKYVLDNYNEYKLGENIEIEDKVNLKVNNKTIDGNICNVNMDIIVYKNDVKLSLYNFYIYDSLNNEIYYPKYNADNNSLKLNRLVENETNNGNIRFEFKDNFSKENLYLIYENNGGKKIKI